MEQHRPVYQPADPRSAPVVQDPLLKAVAAGDGLPRGVPHRILPGLAATGTYAGYQEPRRETGLTYNILAQMGNTSIVRMILWNRIRKAQRYCSRPAPGGRDVGFSIELRNPNAPMTPLLEREIEEITKMLETGGIRLRRLADDRVAAWDGRAEERAVPFPKLIAMMVEDSLLFDAAALRLESPRRAEAHIAYRENPDALQFGSDSPPCFLAPASGRRIRIAEQTYRAPANPEGLRVLPVTRPGEYGYRAKIRPELQQHVAYVELDDRGEVRREFAWDELAYMVRHPQSDNWTVGYGRSELEFLIEAVTGLLGGVAYNTEYFTNSHIPEGILHLAGEGWKDERIEEFQRTLLTKVGGPGQYHRLPILFSPDREAVAQFLGIRNNDRMDMYWEKWINFLITLLCASFGMAPEEVCFQSFRQASQVMQEADPASRLLYAADSGFIPLMDDLAAALNEHIIWRIDDRLVLRWVNLHQQDEQAELALTQTRMNMGIMTVNEARRERGEPEIKDPLDMELYRMCEQRAAHRWPSLVVNATERERLARQLYEHYGGRYGLWPDAPGIPSVVMQLYMQEHGHYLDQGPEGAEAGPGMDALAALGGGGEDPSAPGNALGIGSLQAPDTGSPGTPPSPSSSPTSPQEALMEAVLPPDFEKAIARERPGALRRLLRRLDTWRVALLRRLHLHPQADEGDTSER